MSDRARRRVSVGPLEGPLRDFRHALRALLRRPSFTAVVILSLALGIGGSTAIFSVFNAVLLRDLPYADPDQIYMMRTVTPDGSPTGNVTPRESRPFTDASDHPMVAAAAIAWSQEVQIVDSEERAQSTRRYGVTDRFFEVFGPRMRLGRGFELGEDPGPIVISYALWRDLFGSDEDIVGKSVVAEGFPRQVVGVTPEDFVFPEDPGYWYLMRLGPAYDRSRSYRAYMRLRPGPAGAELQAELDRLSTELGPDPSTGQPVRFVAQPFLDYVIGDLRSTVTILLGATAILLLIACINVTNLLLSRASVGAKEVALREALGAGRWPIVRRLLIESALLASAGGALGAALAVVGVRVLLRLAPADLPRLDAVPLDGTVVLFALGVTALTGLLIGLAPAGLATSSQLRTLINEAGRGFHGGRTARRAFGALVVGELALAVVLVVGAGLLVRTYTNLTRTDPGFDSDGALTLFMNVPGYVDLQFDGMGADNRPRFSGTYYEPMANLFRDVRDRIRALPGVEAVATANSLPLAAAQYDASMVFTLPDRPSGSDGEEVSVAVTRSVDPDFFSAMGMRLLRGRPFEWGDRQGAPGAAIVNESFAARYFQDRDPLGQRIHFTENRYVPGNTGFQLGHLTVDDLQVVGVVEDVKYLALAEPPEPTIYVSTQQWINRRRHLVVRAASDDLESLIPVIRREIEALDRSLTAQFELYPSIVRTSLARERLGMMLIVTFGLTALLLAAVGVYGLMSYSVEQRTGEIAVRSAMGASRRQVIRLVLGQGASHALAGIVLGLAGAAALRRVIESQLYGVSALDPGVLLVVPSTLLAVAILACIVPARRALRVDPAGLLRSE
jgi:putative ABC transport system permease protein